MSNLFASVIRDRPLRKAGHLTTWRCMFHADGDDSESWSCTGYPDGRFYCFSSACGRSGSIIDLVVWSEFGYCAEPGKPITDDAMRKRYHELFLDPTYSTFAKIAKGDQEWSSGREFTADEQMYLTLVYDIMHRDLLKDEQALAYLKTRGCQPLLNMGVARRWQMKEFYGIAREMGDTELPYRCGLVSRNEKYQNDPMKPMHFLLGDSIPVFNVSVDGQVNYYQSRTFRTDREKPYYDPPGIRKRPIIFGSGPVLAAEGWYKVAWAVPYGFTAMATLGKAADKLEPELFKPLNHGLYFVDNDEPDKNGVRAGVRAARVVRNKVEKTALGIQRPDAWVLMRMTPDPFKDSDTWANAVGHEIAVEHIRAAFEAAGVTV